MKLVRRSFKHYCEEDGSGGTWYHSLINIEKLHPLNNETHRKFRDLIYSVILPRKVPDHFFKRHADRCYNMKKFECEIDERPSRYKNIIEEALDNQGDRQRHYVVEKALLESPETMFVIGELPVWLPKGQRVGHIDLIELAEGNPSLVVHDYKPRASEVDPSGQLSMYGLILSTMLKIPLSEIQVGWFDKTLEVLIV